MPVFQFSNFEEYVGFAKIIIVTYTGTINTGAYTILYCDNYIIF